MKDSQVANRVMALIKVSSSDSECPAVPLIQHTHSNTSFLFIILVYNISKNNSVVSMQYWQIIKQNMHQLWHYGPPESFSCVLSVMFYIINQIEEIILFCSSFSFFDYLISPRTSFNCRMCSTIFFWVLCWGHITRAHNWLQLYECTWACMSVEKGTADHFSFHL